MRLDSFAILLPPFRLPAFLCPEFSRFGISASRFTMLDVDARASFALENPAKILSNRIERDAALFFCSHLARVLVAEEDAPRDVQTRETSEYILGTSTNPNLLARMV